MKKKKILLSWVGGQDLAGVSAGNGVTNEGPIESVLNDSGRKFDAAVLLFSGYKQEVKERYKNHLENLDDIDIRFRDIELENPTDYRAIHEAVVDAMAYVAQEFGEKTEMALSVHVSSGTPQMHAVWVLLSSTRFPAELIKTSVEAGVQTIEFPYDISAEILAWTDRQIERVAQGKPLRRPGFDAIIGFSETITRAIEKADRAARSPFAVLLQGESGTGKELFARAIHGGSTRTKEKFVPVNCSALPESLAESEFFGHERGAFTDAKEAKKGYFEQADGGTLFLDEIGELSMNLQAKLLRVLEEKKVRPVGGENERKVDVRIVAATNRDLAEQVRSGSFRSDLYYRLAVLVIGLPPLRDREGDLGLLIDHLLGEVNAELKDQSEAEDFELSPGARNLLIQYSWPGNVRQLKNVLMRLAVLEKPVIGKDDVYPELQILGSHPEDDILGREMAEGFEVESVVGEVMGHYISRALRETPSRRQAAQLLGLDHANTLKRRIDTYQQWIAEE